MIEYKGYAAAIEFDDSVGRVHGRIINSGPYPIATFEAPESLDTASSRRAHLRVMLERF